MHQERDDPHSDKHSSRRQSVHNLFGISPWHLGAGDTLVSGEIISQLPVAGHQLSPGIEAEE
jgi:hypothetical protein